MRYNGSSAASWDFTGGENQEAGEVLVPPSQIPYSLGMADGELPSLLFSLVWHTLPSCLTLLWFLSQIWHYQTLPDLIVCLTPYLHSWHSLFPSCLTPSPSFLPNQLFLQLDTLSLAWHSSILPDTLMVEIVALTSTASPWQRARLKFPHILTNNSNHSRF